MGLLHMTFEKEKEWAQKGRMSFEDFKGFATRTTAISVSWKVFLIDEMIEHDFVLFSADLISTNNNIAG